MPGTVHIKPSFCGSEARGWVSTPNAMPGFATMNVSERCSWHSEAPLARHPRGYRSLVNSSRDMVLIFRVVLFCRVMTNCNSSKNLHYFLIILYCSHLGLSPLSATRFHKVKNLYYQIGLLSTIPSCNLQGILQASVVECLHHRVTSNPPRRPLFLLIDTSESIIKGFKLRRFIQWGVHI